MIYFFDFEVALAVGATISSSLFIPFETGRISRGGALTSEEQSAGFIDAAGILCTTFLTFTVS